LRSKKFLQIGSHEEDQKKCFQRSDNAIDLSPIAASLPWASGIRSVRQNKYWQLALDTAADVLQHFAKDEAAKSLFTSGSSIADISEKELVDIEEKWMRFPSYFFPEANEERAKLLAASNVFIFVFDGTTAPPPPEY
jgi:hypothetical protein